MNAGGLRYCGPHSAAPPDSSIDFPYDISADRLGNVLIANYANGSATEYATATNAPVVTGLGAGYGSHTVSGTSDGAGGVWLASY